MKEELLKEKRKEALRKVRKEVKTLTLLACGLSEREVSRAAMVSLYFVKSIKRKQYKLLKQLGIVKNYESARQELLTAAESMVLTELVKPEKLQEASLKEAAFAFNVLNKASNLEQGKPTSLTAAVFYPVLDKDIQTQRE